MTHATAKKAHNSSQLIGNNERGASSHAPNENASESENKEISNIVRNTRVSLDLKSEKLNYILEMLNELRQLSATVDEPMVAYLIEMAVLETNTAINVLDFGIESERESRAL